jgi:hypothetical protein
VQAQTITEGFEETQWAAVTTTANGSAIISSYVDGTNATAHTGTWRVNSGSTVSRVSSNTASARTWTVHTGERAFYLLSGGGAYIMTPLFPNGVTSISFWVRTHSSGGTPTVYMATNTTITANTASMSASLSSVGAWYGSIQSTIHSSLGWTSVSFNITGAASSAPCYLKIGRTSSSMVIDDIVITTPESTTPLSTPSVAAGPTTATNQGFTAQWADVDNESSYTVKVYNASNQVVKTITDIDADEESVAVTGLSANTTYTYTVTAIGDGETYSNSDESAKSSSIRTLSTAKAITAFTIAGIEADIDGTDITAQIPYSSNWTQTPDVTVSQYADYSPKTAQDFSVPVDYTVTAEDGSQQVYTVTISKAPVSSACDITEFSIVGQISSDIDGQDITVVMPYGTTVSALTPTIDISPAATVDPLSGVAQDFTSPVGYTVVAEDEETYKEYTVTVQIATPTISVTETQIDFSTTGWTASTSTSRAVSGSNLVSNISVSVDAPFQVSNDNSTWNTTATITKSGFTANGTLYVRYNPTSGDGTDNGTVTLSTTGATSKQFDVTGTAAAAINNPGNKNQSVKQNVAIADIVFTVTGGVTEATCTGLPAGVTFDDETYTISGTPTTDVYDAYPYTVTIKGPAGTTDATQTGTITVKDPNAITVAYVYGTTIGGYSLDSDALYAYLDTKFDVTAILEGNIGSTKSAIETNLAAYDVVVLSESTTGSNANIIATEGISKPMVNGKHFVCGGTDDNTARWQWAKANNGTVKTCTVTVTNTSHPVFAGLTLTDGTTTLVNYGMADNKAVGYIYDMTFTGATTLAYSEGSASKIAIQEVPVGTTYETGKQTTHKYVMIAVNNLSYQALTADGLKLYDNAIKYVASAQNLSDAFRSTADGTWTSPSAWESTSNGTTFATGVITPTANASAVTIANNITVPTTSSIQAPATIVVEADGTLTNAGELTIPSGGKLIMEVNNTAAAQVKNDGTLTNSGTVVIRRSFTAAGGWQFVSFPFDVPAANVLVTSTQEQASWGDLTDNGKDFYVAEYDAASRAAGNFNATNSPNWISVTPHVLVANKGYIMAVDNDITLDFISSTGEADLFETSAQVSVAKHPAVFPSNQDWNLIGVPFASSYELANASAEHAPYYCHNGATYSTVMPEDTYEASPFTAFFLQAYGAPEVVSFASNGRLVKAATVKDFSEIALVVKNAKYSDMTRIRLQNGASAAYELGKDAVKFFSNKAGVPQIASKLGALALSVNSVPANTTKVDLTVTITEDGTYTINLDGAAEGCSQVILVDGDVETDLLANEYSFAGTAGSTKNMSVLLVTEGTTAVGTAEGGSILIQTIGNKAYINGLDGAAVVNVYDVAGKLVQRFTNVNNGDALTLNNAGVAIIDVKTATQTAKAKVSVKK